MSSNCNQGIALSPLRSVQCNLSANNTVSEADYTYAMAPAMVPVCA